MSLCLKLGFHYCSSSSSDGRNREHRKCECFAKKQRKLINWCFQPSQPKRITPGLKTKFNLSPNYLSIPLITSLFSKTTTQIISIISEYKPKQNNNMFWSLFIFCEDSAWEPASIVCHDEQGDLSYSAGPHRN